MKENPLKVLDSCWRKFGILEKKRQKFVVLSVLKQNFVVLLRGLLKFYGLENYSVNLVSHKKEIVQSSISISENLIHEITKHIEVDRLFIKENLEAKIVILPYVRSMEQLADIGRN